MMLTEETVIADAALPLAEFKAHLKLGTGFADANLQDVTLISLLRAAMAAVEARTGKALLERDFAWTVYAWRDGTGEVFPIAPVGAVTDLISTDADDVATTLPVTDVRVEADQHRPVLRPRASCLPGVPTGGSVTVKFTAGVAVDWGGLPADLGHAVILLAAHYYERRDDTSLGDGCMPFGVTSLIQRYRPVRLHLGVGS
ncbi:MAG: head-tail connector protein [Marinibacterium sp.]